MLINIFIYKRSKKIIILIKMKYLKLIFAISLFSIILTDAIPTQGYFVFTPYTDSSCMNNFIGINGSGAGIYSGAKTCWDVSSSANSKYSFKANSWTPTNSTIGLDVFTNVNDCSGIKSSSNFGLQCNGSCLSDDINKRYYTCIYINIPNGNFNFTAFSDNTCKTNLGSAIYTNSNLCWPTGVSKSLVPWSYSNSNITLITFNTSAVCQGPVAGVGNIQCDGTCLADKMNVGQYYSCKLNSSGLTIGIMTLIAVIFTLI
jgi:predicted outer membrane repeat protein